jgi:hypothetical protein
LAKLDPPITEFTPGVVDRYPALAEGPAMQSADRITSLADAEPMDFNTLAAPLAGYRVLYPDRASRLDDRVARRLETRVRALLEQTPLQVAALGRPLEGFAELFPDRSGALRETVALGLERRIEALTDAGPAQLASLSTPLSQFSALFPVRSDGLRKSVAMRLEEQIKGLAEKASLDLVSLESPLKVYGALFPHRLAALTDNVGARVAERIQATRPATPENFASLVKPLEQFKRLFAARYPALKTSLAARAAKEIRRLQPRDVYKADALKRASLKALPGSEAITAIRLELPLPEIIDGKKLLAAGRVTAASKKLDEAVATDPRHSDIPAFREALEERMKRAEADYDTYVSNVSQRKERTQSQRLYASATKLWVDNPAFIKVEAPRAGACKAYLAGYGGSKRSTCYDYVSKRQKGPLMVVVPAGGLFKAPYAIGKYEVTVADFNRYCRATKACKVAPRKKSKLPVTGISLEQAENYARWLSKQASVTEKTEVVYKLPTESEWEYAAKAAGKQPEGKKFNCRVKSGSDIIKGHALVDAKSGQQNGWGVTNYIGNAREWAKGSSGVVVLGGAFEDSLTECSLSLKRSHSGDADDLTGFRLVREIRS